ncbi:Acetyl-coenzyme A synthetase 2-like, mitochondrial [Saguinus oedipus]|uniref:Acetyl-coenzyme A synthetase 2-like, mitochondrial n=1 Tax=Saguinus oedipus TaxID=9490 RepID=A0ABQ9VJA0_SAGOE|nr:Acetyl-coenzyme A synthetase 2-like, mitochondrial [Saguinus oedipus]
MAMRPFFGIVPVLMDEKVRAQVRAQREAADLAGSVHGGSAIEGGNVSGALCISQAWPGMARTIYGDHQRFVDAYFKAYPGYYFTGDGAYRTEGGYYQITGRMDDVINISGHRLGTAEIEDAMADHPAVPESAVIGYPHDIKGEAPLYEQQALESGVMGILWAELLVVFSLKWKLQGRRLSSIRVS